MDTPEGTFDSFSWTPSASLGNPLIPISLVQLWSCPFLCKCFWILFTLNILSAHLLPFKTSCNSHQRKFCRHSAGRMSVLTLQGRNQCIQVWCCCNSSQGGMLLWQWHWAAAAPLKAHLEASQGEPKQRPDTTQLHRKSRSVCNVAILTLMQKPY